MKVKQVMYKSYSNLWPQEKRFYNLYHEKYGLNTCDKCEMIDSICELLWDCDFDLKGFTCLCKLCFKKLEDKGGINDNQG